MKKNNFLTWIAIILAILLAGLLLWLVIYQIKEHHLQDDPMLHHLKTVLSPIHPVISQLRLYKGNKSYTLNKSKIFLCLKDRSGEYYPLSTLSYVLLHEVAHLLNSKDVGHTEEFHRVFDDLLDKAKQLQIYNPAIPIPEDYCT